MPLFTDFLLIFIIALLIVLLFHRLKIPSTLGLLTTGVLIGPSAFGIMEDPKAVETIAELGLIPLLFVVGIEFSMTELKRLREIALLGGGFQVLTTSLLVAFLVSLTGIPLRGSIFLGFVVALSSTALVTKVLIDRFEVDTPQGKVLIGILLAQDLFGIVLMFLLPIFGAKEVLLSEGVIRLILAVSVILIIFFASQRVLPKAFYSLARVKDREVFTIATFIFVIGIVWLTSKAGLSIALGAFLAGIIISEQEYKHYVAAQILPFKDILTSLFFISIGMLFNLGFFIDHISIILFITLLVILSKSLLSFLSTMILGYPLRIALIAGLGLSQLGEFSFVLAGAGKDYMLITEDYFQIIVAVTIFTLFVTPFLMRLSSTLGYAFSKLPSSEEVEAPEDLSNHTVVIGYGLNGRNLAKVLKSVNLPYIVIDLDPGVVKEGKEDGYDVVFGDAVQHNALKRIGIERARMCVITISDRLATEKILSMIRIMNPNLRVLVRTRYIADVKRLFELGASQVIPEEFETSVEIFVRVLKEYGVPSNVITSQVAFIRQDGYRMLRDTYAPHVAVEGLMAFLKESVTDTFLVRKGSRMDGKTLKEADLRRETGVTVLAVIRDTKSFVNPESDFYVKEGDCLVLLGSHAQLDKAYSLLEG